MAKKLLVLLFMLLGLCGAACAESGFKVGVVLPLSGALAEYGVAEKNGFELAQREHPELFGKVKFLFEDSRYDNTAAVTIFNKFVEQGQVSLVYLWGYGPNQSVSPLAEVKRFPLFSATAEQGIARGKQYVVRYNYYAEQLSRVLLDQLRARGFKRFAVVKTEIAYNDAVFEGMKQFLKPDETLELVDTFGVAANDFKTSIIRLKPRAFDALGVFLISGQVSQFFKEMRQLHYQIPTFGTDFFESMSEVKQAEGAMEGSLFGAAYVSDEFINRYRAVYGNDVQVSWAAHAYEFALLTGRLFGGEQGKIGAGEVLGRFRSAGVQHGVVGEYHFEDSPAGPGFRFEVRARRIGKEKIEDL